MHEFKPAEFLAACGGGQTSVCPRNWKGKSHEEVSLAHSLDSCPLACTNLKVLSKNLGCSFPFGPRDDLISFPETHIYRDRKVAASVYVVDRSVYRLVRHKSGHKCFVQAISRLLPCSQYSVTRSSGLTRPKLVSHCIWVNKFKLFSSNGQPSALTTQPKVKELIYRHSATEKAVFCG